MPKPATLVTDLAHLPTVLVEHLVKLERWVIWRWEERVDANGVTKWTKVPYQARFPQSHAKTNDPFTWAKYTDAVAAATSVDVDGIGFMLRDGDIAAADLDKVRDAQSGELVNWVKPLVAEAQKLSLYVEVTVSGTGLRFIGLAPNGLGLHEKYTLNQTTKEGIELYRNCTRYITVSGVQHGTCAKLGNIDAYLDELKKRFGPPPLPRTLNLNKGATLYSSDYYKNLIMNGVPVGQRSEKFQSVVWHLARHGWSVDRIVDELGLYPNGIAEKYINRLYDEVKRSYDKWLQQQWAQITGAYSSGTTSTSSSSTTSSSLNPGTAAPSWMPQIKVIPGELPRIIKEAEDALLLLGHEIYQRGDILVRPVLNKSLRASSGHRTESWQFVPVKKSYLDKEFSCAARFLRYDRRAHDFVPIDPPDKIAEAYLDYHGEWRLPRIASIVNTPFLRIDGSICETPGYDPQSYILFKPEAQIFPPVLQQPNKGDAIVALGKLRNLISTFPFVGNADRSVMLAAMLTVLDRKSMRNAPLFAFSKPTSRTGASLLVNLLGTLATGRAVPVMRQGNDQKEFEKALKAHLLAAEVCISIDNCTLPLAGDLLCQALSEEEINIRIFGVLRNIRTENIATILATGNNLIIADDVAKRCLLCTINAKMEQPGQRKFNIDVIEEAQMRRGELVVAALTILRAWYLARAAGEHIEVEVYGGFEDWTRRVREALIWLGETDPNDTTKTLHENDPVREALEAVLIQWKEKIGLRVHKSVHEIIQCANMASPPPPGGLALVYSPFHTALLEVAAEKSGRSISPERLGWWLKRMEGRIVNDLRIVKASTKLHGLTQWSVEPK